MCSSTDKNLPLLEPVDFSRNKIKSQIISKKNKKKKSNLKKRRNNH